MKKFLPLMLAACAAPIAALSLISVSDEIQLGKQAQQEVRKQVPELNDSIVVGHVRSIGRQLASRAGGPRYPYTFTVANYREINAFALPGGPVWIHRGVIHAAANEAQLASVIAHEIAHIAQRHAADQITKSLVANGFLGLLGAVLGNDRGARAAQMGAQILAGGYMLKFSRDDEREADRVGAQILRRAGWDARAMAEFMDTLHREGGRNPSSVEVFLSSHPAPAERAALLRKSVRAGGRRDSDTFARVKARLKQLRPAQSMPRGR
ncbi:MAG TPA: M48 family metallopeptidase [Vicinamibacterales bacterium]|nr:M48 family metallopeptidase [Vicinamibacterales bacterium]